jgi:hypothetical protein
MTQITSRNRTGRRIAAVVAAATGAAALLGACSSGGGPKPTASPATAAGSAATTGTAPAGSSSSTSTQAAGGAVNPNAPEVNESGDIPDNQVYVAYTPPSGGFSVKVPEGWARAESGAAVTFSDKLNHVRMEMVDAPTAPTVASVTDTDLPAIRAASAHYEAGTVKTVTRKAGPAVLATYKADAPPNAVTGKVVHDDVERYVFWRAGKAVVLTLSGPVGADNVDPWKIVTDSVTWK